MAQHAGTSKAMSQAEVVLNPFHNTTLTHPGLRAQESYYFTYPDSRPKKRFLEVAIKPEDLVGLPDFQGVTKSGPRWPEILLRHPELIPLDARLIGTKDLDRVTLSPEAVDPSIEERLDIEIDRPINFKPRRDFVEINGMIAAITYDPGSWNSATDLFDRTYVHPFDSTRPPWVVISTPPTTHGLHVSPSDLLRGDKFLNRFGGDTPRFAVTFSGVAINIQNNAVSGNNFIGDLLCLLTGAMLARRLFSIADAKGHPVFPRTIAHGGSWGSGIALAATLMRPDLFQGAVTTSSPINVSEFKNFITHDQTKLAFLTGLGGIPTWDGTDDYSNMGLSLVAQEFEQTASPPANLAQVISLLHRTESLASQISVFLGDSDFTFDANGKALDELTDSLEALGKEDHVDVTVFPHTGHGTGVTGEPTGLALIEFDEFCRFEYVEPANVDPFAVDSSAPQGFEDSIYQQSLHFVPRNSEKVIERVLEPISEQSGVSAVYPARRQTMQLLPTPDNPSHILLGSGDGRILLFEVHSDPWSLVPAGESDSHGFGVPGLFVEALTSNNYRVVVTSSIGLLRTYSFQLPGPGQSATFELTQQLASLPDTLNPAPTLLGRDTQVTETSYDFTYLSGVPNSGRILFLYGTPRQVWKRGEQNGPALFVDSGDVTRRFPTQTDVLSIVREVKPKGIPKTLFVCSMRGYAGLLDPHEPMVQAAGGEYILKFLKISDYLGLTPRHATYLRVADKDYYIIVGAEGFDDVVLLDSEFKVVDRHPTRSDKTKENERTSGPGTTLPVGKTRFSRGVVPCFFRQRPHVLVYGPLPDPDRKGADGIRQFVVQEGGTLSTSKRVPELFKLPGGVKGTIQAVVPFTRGSQNLVLVTVSKGTIGVFDYDQAEATALASSKPSSEFGVYTNDPDQATSAARTRVTLQGLSQSPAGKLYAVDRITGGVLRLQDDLSLLEEAITLKKANPPDILNNVIVEEPPGEQPFFLPVADKGSRLRILDETSPTTHYGNCVALLNNLYVDSETGDNRDLENVQVHDLASQHLADPVANRQIELLASQKWRGQRHSILPNASQMNFYFGRSVQFVQVGQARSIIVAGIDGWVATYRERMTEGKYYLAVDENLGGRNCYGLDVKRGERKGELVIYRGLISWKDRGGCLERWRLVHSKAKRTSPRRTSGHQSLPRFSYVLDWRMLLDRPIMGVRYIGEAGPDQGRLIVGDVYGHVYVYNAKNDRSSQPQLLMRTKALKGAAGANGFLYHQDLTSGERTITFSTARSTVKMRLVDPPSP